MPEWPEVTLTARALHDLCAKQSIVKVDIENILKHNVAPFTTLKTSLPCTVQRVWNKGKNIILELSNDMVILSHMMLTGSWTTVQNEYVCVTLHLENGSLLYYRDTRRFGRLDYCTQKQAKTYLEKVQPDMFQLKCTDFISAMRKKNRTGVYSCIMDQNAVLSGVGNYVAAEALYRAKLHPQCRISKLSDAQLKTLLLSIRAVCEESLEYQGVSVADYVGIDSKPGMYQLHLKVYKNSAHKIKINGRTCYWDPEVQTIM